MDVTQNAVSTVAPCDGGAAEYPHAVPVGTPFEKRFGPSRSTQFDLINRGELSSFLVGDKRGRRYIITQSWLDYIERQRRKESAGKIGTRSPNPKARNFNPAPRYDDLESLLKNSDDASTGGDVEAPPERRKRGRPR